MEGDGSEIRSALRGGAGGEDDLSRADVDERPASAARGGDVLRRGVHCERSDGT